MGTYGLKGVLSMWKAGQLTNEQAIGQLLQLLEIIELRLNELKPSADTASALKRTKTWLSNPF